LPATSEAPKAVIANYEESGGSLRQVRAATYHSRDYRSLEDILAAYLMDSPGAAPRATCLGVAGTVIDGKCRTTNLPWQLDEQALAREVGAPRVKLLNDLEATGYGILHLPADELCALNPGIRPGRQGNAAVIVAGAGLGEGTLFWGGVGHYPIASEGGHVDFAPRTD
jgi:glucokinase